MTLHSSTITLEQFAHPLDHSLLQPQLTEADVRAGCEIAAKYHAASDDCDGGGSKIKEIAHVARRAS